MVPTSDALTTRPRGQILTVYIGHTIRVPATFVFAYTRYILGTFVYCLISTYLFISIFVTETIIYNNGSMDISDTFLLLYFVQKMRKYPSDISVAENSIDPNL